MRKSMLTINIINTNAVPTQFHTLHYGLRMAQLRAARALAALSVMHERARQRRTLARLDDRQLDDIGYARAVALAEAAKPFWCA